MTEMFGSQWLNEYGDVPNATWSGELQKLTAAQVEEGIEQCKRSGSSFAPRLPQFLAWCKPTIVKAEDFYKAYRETQLFLAQIDKRRSVKKNMEVKRVELEKMKKS